MQDLVVGEQGQIVIKIMFRMISHGHLQHNCFFFFFVMILSRGAALQRFILLPHMQKLDRWSLFLSLLGKSIILSKIQGVK